MMRLEPRLLIWSSTRACAPAPTATIVITAPTPMMMPSIVSAERSLLTRSAASATRSVARKFIGTRPPRGFRRRSRCAASARAGVARARLRVSETILPSRNASSRDANVGDVVLVRDDDDRDAARG